MSVVLQHVTVRIGKRTVLQDVNLNAPTGGVTGLIGPNGSGKSTLLRTVFRSRPPASGRVLIHGRDVWSISAREAARQVAVMLQDSDHAAETRVEEIVALARIPHRGSPQALGDQAAVNDALTRTGTTDIRRRSIASLSGGQRQKVQLARALAQATPVLLLDEPTNHLDIRARSELFAIVRGLHGTTVAALHDLDLAAAHCDHLVVLQHGHLIAAGSPEAILTTDLIAAVYGVEAEIGVNPLTGRLTVHLGDHLLEP